MKLKVKVGKWKLDLTLFKVIWLMVFLAIDVYGGSRFLPTGITTLLLTAVKDYFKHS